MNNYVLPQKERAHEWNIRRNNVDFGSCFLSGHVCFVPEVFAPLGVGKFLGCLFTHITSHFACLILLCSSSQLCSYFVIVAFQCCCFFLLFWYALGYWKRPIRIVHRTNRISPHLQLNNWINCDYRKFAATVVNWSAFLECAFAIHPRYNYNVSWVNFQCLRWDEKRNSAEKQEI